MANARIDSIDVLRGVAIAGVAGLHVSWRLLQPLPLLGEEARAVVLFNLACTYGAPMFLALSAAAMSLRYDRPFGSVAAYGAFLRRRAVRLLPAYVLWSVLSALVHDPALLAGPGRIASLLLRGTADAQLYFVPMLFQLYLVWPLLRPFAAAARSSLATGAAVVAAGAAVSLAAWYGYLPGLQFMLVMFLVHACAGLAIARLLIGKRSNSGRFASFLSAIVAAAALFAFQSRFFEMVTSHPTQESAVLASMIFQPLPTLYILAFLLTAALAAPHLARTAAGAALARIGRASYGIFLCHLLVARFVVYPWARRLVEADAFPIGVVIVAWLVTLGLSRALTTALSSRPATAWTVGAEAA